MLSFPSYTRAFATTATLSYLRTIRQFGTSAFAHMEELAALCCKLALLPVEQAFEDWMDEEDEFANLRVAVVDEVNHRPDGVLTQGSSSEERDDENGMMKCDDDDNQQQQQQQQQRQRREQRWHDRSLACHTGRTNTTGIRTTLSAGLPTYTHF